MSTPAALMSSSPQPYNILIKLESEGELSALTTAGVLSTSVLQYFQIAKRMQELRAKRKRDLMGTLVSEVAGEFGVKRTTVYKAVKLFSGG